MQGRGVSMGEIYYGRISDVSSNVNNEAADDAVVFVSVNMHLNP